jgi:hypothetical protein
VHAQDYPESDSRHSVARMSEPKAQSLFETTAEVLNVLNTAYEYYATGAEPAMSAR